jgi:hypothetical protein
LQRLFLSYNHLKNISFIKNFSVLKKVLNELTLDNNPMSNDDKLYKNTIIHQMTLLKKLDNKLITDDERRTAHKFFFSSDFYRNQNSHHQQQQQQQQQQRYENELMTILQVIYFWKSFFLIGKKTVS